MELQALPMPIGDKRILEAYILEENEISCFKGVDCEMAKFNLGILSSWIANWITLSEKDLQKESNRTGNAFLSIYAKGKTKYFDFYQKEIACVLSDGNFWKCFLYEVKPCFKKMGIETTGVVVYRDVVFIKTEEEDLTTEIRKKAEGINK